MTEPATDFAELLRTYIARTGVSDAELARAMGVSRQTVFRWKEGLVAGPRHRDNVIDMARKLRLTAEERDELLLAAGFPPLDLDGTLSKAAAKSAAPEPERARVSRRRPMARRLLARRKLVGAASIATAVLISLALARLTLVDSADQTIRARGSESLVLVAARESGTNELSRRVAADVVRRANREIRGLRIPDARVVLYPDAVSDLTTLDELRIQTSSLMVVRVDHSESGLTISVAPPWPTIGPPTFSHDTVEIAHSEPELEAVARLLVARVLLNGGDETGAAASLLASAEVTLTEGSQLREAIALARATIP